jgi:hypothetical protein
MKKSISVHSDNIAIYLKAIGGKKRVKIDLCVAIQSCGSFS